MNREEVDWKFVFEQSKGWLNRSPGNKICVHWDSKMKNGNSFIYSRVYSDFESLALDLKNNREKGAFIYKIISIAPKLHSKTLPLNPA